MSENTNKSAPIYDKQSSQSPQIPQSIVRGQLTYGNTASMAPFFLPWQRDPFGIERPVFSIELMRLSAELSASIYTLNISDWQKAGWQDFSFQIDNKVRSGVLLRSDGSPRKEAYNQWVLNQMRLSIRQSNPVKQIMGAVRQRQTSDTGKALIMIHPWENGRYVVAIGFMGTGSRFYDWFSNFKFSNEEGMHQGFLQLARKFMQDTEIIYFKDTAQSLGLKNLSLSDIIQEATREDSRFLLWLSGHSQGGAILQTWSHLLISEKGVLPKNIVGYGFASPTVMLGTTVQNPANYPLYHIINSDDFVPRTGAQVHLGLCMTYHTCEELRSTAYGWDQSENAITARNGLYKITQRMIDMPTTIELCVAYLQAIAKEPIEDLIEIFSFLHLPLGPIRQIIQASNLKTENILRLFRRRIEAGYYTITNMRLNPDLINKIEAEIDIIIAKVGLKPLTMAMGEMMYWPHVLLPDKNTGTSGYLFIIQNKAKMLQPSIWQYGTHPIRQWAQMPSYAIAQKPELLPNVYNKRLPATQSNKKNANNKYNGFSARRSANTPAAQQKLSLAKKR